MEREPFISVEAEDELGERVQKELAHHKPGPKKRMDKNSRKQVTVSWSWDLEKRFGIYIVNKSYEERRDVDRSEVVEQAVNEFLSNKGY